MLQVTALYTTHILILTHFPQSSNIARLGVTKTCPIYTRNCKNVIYTVANIFDDMISRCAIDLVCSNVVHCTIIVKLMNL